MSWHLSTVFLNSLCSRGLVAVSSEGISSEPDASEPSRSKTTQGESYKRGRKTGASRRSRSGTTSEPSASITLNAPTICSAFALSLIGSSCLEDSHAKTSPLQAPNGDSMETGRDSGLKCCELLARYDLDSSSWRTAQTLFDSGFPLFPQDWPKSGMTRSGKLLELPTLEHHTVENACGFWPTPTATQFKGWSPGHNRANTDDRLDYKVEREGGMGGGTLNPTWVEWLMGWPLGWTSTEPMSVSTWVAWQKAFGIESEDSRQLEMDKSQPALPNRS